MDKKAPSIDLTERARAAALGDRDAAREVLDAVQDGVYELALRMLGHPADAEDAAQEILVIVLTHLGSFRGESAFQTWVWRIAANRLARIRRGRRETIAFDTLDENLRTGLADDAADGDPESAALTRELRLRCTEAMLLSLDRELRIAYVLGDILNLSGDEAAEVLEIDPATYRKRLSRARGRLHEFLRGWCGVFDPANPCRCGGQVVCARQRGLIAPDDLYLSRHRSQRRSQPPAQPAAQPRSQPAAQPTAAALDRATDELTGLMRVADVMRGPATYLAPDSMIESLRQLLESERLELLRH
jgi:RNA polymerase sigma factor (sigma-70 family)